MSILYHSVNRLGPFSDEDLIALSGTVDAVEIFSTSHSFAADIMLKDSIFAASLDETLCELIGEETIKAIKSGDSISFQFSKHLDYNENNDRTQRLLAATLEIEGKQVLTLEQSNHHASVDIVEPLKDKLRNVIIALLCIAAICVVCLITLRCKDNRKM